jgi:Uma2 family endonuclease
MEVMTMTDTVGTNPIGYRKDGWWTIDDLVELPDDDMRYEIVDGCLLVSPAPATDHGYVLARLRRLLDKQAPPDLAVSNDLGIEIGSKYSYFIPDLFVVPWSPIRAHPKHLLSADVRLIVEILSEHNHGRDLVLKRHCHAAAGIPRYWIVDPAERSLTVLTLHGKTYQEEVAVKAGAHWSTDVPSPLELDPADFCP